MPLNNIKIKEVYLYMEVVYVIVSLLLLAFLIALAFKNHLLQKHLQEVELSLSVVTEKYNALKSEPSDKYPDAPESDIYDIYLNKEIRPLLSEPEFLVYSGLLNCAKDSVLLHSDLDPRDILSQVCFFNERGWTKNEGVLLEIIKDYYGSAMVQFTNNSDEFDYLYPNEVEQILPLYIEKFRLSIPAGGIDEITHGHEASYRRSPDGLAKLFSNALFESNTVQSRLSVLDDQRFHKIVHSFFFDLIAYDIEDFPIYIERIIDRVLQEKANYQIY